LRGHRNYSMDEVMKAQEYPYRKTGLPKSNIYFTAVMLGDKR
jgi:hypothetical protein